MNQGALRYGIEDSRYPIARGSGVEVFVGFPDVRMASVAEFVREEMAIGSEGEHEAVFTLGSKHRERPFGRSVGIEFDSVDSSGYEVFGDSVFERFDAFFFEGEVRVGDREDAFGPAYDQFRHEFGFGFVFWEVLCDAYRIRGFAFQEELDEVVRIGDFGSHDGFGKRRSARTLGQELGEVEIGQVGEVEPSVFKALQEGFVGDVESRLGEGFALDGHLTYPAVSGFFHEYVDLGDETLGVRSQVQVLHLSAADWRPRGDFDAFERADSVFRGELREFAVHDVVLGSYGELHAVLHAPCDRFGAGRASVGHRGMEMEVGFVDYGVRRSVRIVTHGFGRLSDVGGSSSGHPHHLHKPNKISRF